MIHLTVKLFGICIEFNVRSAPTPNRRTPLENFAQYMPTPTPRDSALTVSNR